MATFWTTTNLPARPNINRGYGLKLQCLDLVAAFLLGVSSAVCTCQPPTTSMFARFRLPAWSSARAWLLRLQTGSDFDPARLPTPDPVCMCPPLFLGALWPMHRLALA